MKIVAIIGSPKGKGSGYRIVQMVEERMKQMGTVDLELEYLFLKDANLGLCKGCFACVTRGEDHCPLKDGRAAIEQKLLAADGVILSSPAYVENVSWLMKGFIDRFAYTNHRLQFFRQKVMLTANSGGAGLKPTLYAMRNTLGGARVVCELGVSTPPWPQTEHAVAKKEKAITAAADRFYQACLDTGMPAPTFNEYMRFVIQKKVSEECRQWLPADYEYYKDKKYHYETKIGPVKKTAAGVMVGLAMRMMKDLGPGPVKWPPSIREM